MICIARSRHGGSTWRAGRAPSASHKQQQLSVVELLMAAYWLRQRNRSHSSPSKLASVVYVAPAGGDERAVRSACAASIAAMAPGTSIEHATPVEVGADLDANPW